MPSTDIWHLEWGAQVGSAAEVAKDLLLTQNELTNTGFSGTSTTRSGSSSTNTYRGTLTNAAYITVCGTGSKTNVGTYRVRARVYASGTGPYSVRLAWRDGDGALTRNPIAYPLDDQWTDVDLGTIDIEEAPGGTQSWEGRIEAKSAVNGDTMDVDYIALIPTGAGYGLARRPLALPTVTSLTARSDFSTESGAITGDSLAVGGTWAGAGDADDFSAAGGVATRTAISDTASSIANGRLVTASGTSAMTNTFASLDVSTSAHVSGSTQGLLLRYVDASNFYAVALVLSSSASPPVIATHSVVSGTPTIRSVSAAGIGNATVGVAYPLQVVVDAGGHVLVWIGGVYQTSFSDTALVTGGALDDGKVGMVDYHPSASAATRTYDNFTVSPAEVDAVVFKDRAAQIRHDSAIRTNSTGGTIWGGMPLYRGSRFYLPESGDDDRQFRVIAKARPNDNETMTDTLGGTVTAQVFYTPRYLTPR